MLNDLYHYHQICFACWQIFSWSVLPFFAIFCTSFCVIFSFDSSDVIYQLEPAPFSPLLTIYCFLHCTSHQAVSSSAIFKPGHFSLIFSLIFWTPHFSAYLLSSLQPSFSKSTFQELLLFFCLFLKYPTFRSINFHTPTKALCQSFFLDLCSMVHYVTFFPC